MQGGGLKQSRKRFFLHRIPRLLLNSSTTTKTHRVVQIVGIEKAHSAAPLLQYSGHQFVGAKNTIEEAVSKNLVFQFDVLPNGDA